jgi:sugar lactone lactonase YvrE
MRTYRAGPAFGPAHALAEGPRWDDASGTASWVDIVGGEVFRAELTGDTFELVDAMRFPDTVGAAVPTTAGGMAVAAHDRIVVVRADGSRSSSEPVIDRSLRLRLNDAAVDPGGRLLVGSLALDHRPGAAGIFRVEASGAVTTLRDGMNLANGIGWSPDGSILYAVDSVPGIVWSAAYDVRTGDAHGWTPLITQFAGLPDGLCVDREGHLWVAHWDGSRVGRYSPSGDLVAVVDLPVPHVTAVAFVGPERDRLLVTSAFDELDESRRRLHPDSGRLFLVEVDARGLPTPQFDPHFTSETTETP